jgi:SprT protein
MTGVPTSAELTTRARLLLESVGVPQLAALVQVQWNARMRTTAGTAQPRTQRIDLNPRLLTAGLDEVERTLRHEAAHLLAHWRAGRRRIQTHGSEWRQACADLGIPGEKVTHTLPLAPRRKQMPKYFYQCPGCGIEVRRVRLFKRPTACLICCRQHNGGRFDARYQFRRIPPPLPSPG